MGCGVAGRGGGPAPGLLLWSGPCHAGPRAWDAAQARPAPPGRASPGPLAAGPGHAWAGPKNGPWARPTGSGCMANYVHIHRYPNIFDPFMPMLAILSNVDSHHVFVALTEFETIRVSMVLTT